LIQLSGNGGSDLQVLLTATNEPRRAPLHPHPSLPPHRWPSSSLSSAPSLALFIPLFRPIVAPPHPSLPPHRWPSSSLSSAPSLPLFIPLFCPIVGPPHPSLPPSRCLFIPAPLHCHPSLSAHCCPSSWLPLLLLPLPHSEPSAAAVALDANAPPLSPAYQVL